MRRSVALLLLAVTGLCLAAGGHNHHNNHKHSHSDDQVGDEHYKRPVDFAPQYRQQKEYIYQYDTQIATGLSDQQQNAVQRMRAQMRMTFTSDNAATVQLENWQSARLNEEIHQSANQMMSFESLRSTEIPKRHLEMLEKPFEISYEQGKVKDITFDSEDKTWSENIKRGAINAFQMNMQNEERDSMTYRVNETTIEGECQSVYTIIPSIKCNTVKSTEGRHFETKDKGQCAQITKSINHDMCKQRPDLRYNHYRGEEIYTTSTLKQKEQRALQQSTISQIELKKDEGKHILRFARVVSQQSLHLTEKTSMISVSIGELQLKGIKKPTQNADEVQKRKSASSLMYSLEFDEMMEQFMQDGNEDYLKKQPYLTERNIPEVLISISKRLSQSFIGNSQDEWSMDSDSAAHQFTNLVKILRHATKKDLEKFEESFQKSDAIQSDKQKSDVERLYIDALALAGTQPTIQRLLQRMDEKKLTEREAAYTLQKLARNIQVVNQGQLNAVWQVCKKSKVGTDMQHSCVLSYARMANVLCGRTQREQSKKIGDVWAQDKKEGKERCSESLKTELINNVQQLFDNANSNKDSQQRILALKAFGNMGIDSMIQKLEQVINNRELPRLERIVAIDAMRLLTTQIPAKVRRVLMNVFIDKREYPEIRMNAIHQILRSQPDQPTISQIAMETLKESNYNLRTFIMSEMHSLSILMRKTNPKVAQHLQNSIQLFKRTSPQEMEQMRKTNSRFNTMRTEDGSLYSLAALFSNDSSLPKELLMQLDAQFAEHFIPAYAQLGLHQQDIEQLITKLYDRVGQQPMNEILVRGKRSVLNSLYEEPVETMKKMFDRLRTVAQRNPNAQPSLMFYQREKNMDMWFVLIDDKHMPEALKGLLMDGRVDLSGLETQGTRQLNSISADFIFETKIKVPTTFGVPLVSTQRFTKVSALHGSISTELNSQGKYVTSGRVSLKSTPKVSMKMIQKLEAFSPLFTAGVQLQHNLDAQIPLALEAKFSARNGLIVDFKLPESNDRTYKLLTVSSHPSTLFREWPSKSRVYIEHEEHTLLMPQLQDSFVNIDKQMHCPLSFMKVEVQGHMHTSEQGMYLGENVMEVHAHFNEKTAKIIRFQARFDSASANGQSLEPQRLMRVFDDERKELFKDSAKPEEIQMLKEYINRHSTHAHRLHEIDLKLMALQNKESETPREQIEFMTKALCDKDMKVCHKEMHVEIKGVQLTGSFNEPWTADMKSIIARPTVTGLHGSIRSEHVLIHSEAEFGNKQNKNTLTLCAYGRPSQWQIQQWNEMKNMRSAARQSDSETYESMEDEDYDRMVLKQLPSRLYAKHYSFLVEYQLSPESMKQVQPYVQYSMLRNKSPSQITAWALKQEELMSRSHGQIKGDVIFEGKQIQVQVHDLEHLNSVPSWSNPSFMAGQNGGYEERMQRFGDRMQHFGDRMGQKLSLRNSEETEEENKENELENREVHEKKHSLTQQRYKFSTSKSEESSDEMYDNMENKNQRMRGQQQTESQEQKKSNKGKKHRNGRKQQQDDDTFKSLQSSTEDDSDYGRKFKKINPVPMTKVIEEQDVICFSVQPQMSCPEGSFPINENWFKNSEEDQTPEVEFVCMSRHGHQAQQLVKKLRRGTKVLKDLETMRDSRRMPVKQVKSCSRQQQSMPEY